MGEEIPLGVHAGLGLDAQLNIVESHQVLQRPWICEIQVLRHQDSTAHPTCFAIQQFLLQRGQTASREKRNVNAKTLTLGELGLQCRRHLGGTRIQDQPSYYSRFVCAYGLHDKDL